VLGQQEHAEDDHHHPENRETARATAGLPSRILRAAESMPR
jgi:hypothetical protein